MDAVFRALIIYMVLLFVFRLVGRRTLSQASTFDLVLLLIVSEATQQALLGEDYSLTHAVLVILTLVAADYGLGLWKHRSHIVQKWLDGVPTILVADGTPLKAAMDRARVDEADVLKAARERQGLERMDQIKYAVLEASGGISIVPKSGSPA